jgi:hypothetical protein
MHRLFIAAIMLTLVAGPSTQDAIADLSARTS